MSTAAMSPADRWRSELAAWAIPQPLLDAAPESPYLPPPEFFAAPDWPVDTWSRHIAAQVLPAGGTLLDVGCGPGAAGLALAPPAGQLTGVDVSEPMLAAFDAAATARDVPHRCILGRWPEVAGDAPVADVAVAHHVAYNVADLAGFALALTAHARRRVVLELTERHPWADTGWLWERFHRLARPAGPTAELAAAVLTGAGLDVQQRRWQAPAREHPPADLARLTRRRLCLPASREPEVAAALAAAGPAPPRRLVTLWWDVAVDAGQR